jgi:hypothetical protein
LDLNYKNVAGLCGFNVEGAGEVVNLCQVDVAHVVCGVVVADLAAGPVDAFDFDDFVGLDSGVGRVVWVPSVL